MAVSMVTSLTFGPEFFLQFGCFIRQQRAWMIWGFVIVVVVTIGLAALFSVIGGLPSILGGGGISHHTSGSAPPTQGGN